MDAALGFIFVLATLVGLTILLGYAYRRRHKIAGWLNDPTVPNAYVTDRKLTLKRRIEDAERELEALNQQEEKE